MSTPVLDPTLIDEQHEVFLPPSAVDLLEAMRALGYSFEAALADLIDNSLAAAARKIELKFSPYNVPYVAILDDGHGMASEDLTAAMRHGSSDPKLARDKHDLGRFGLGLKTASLSQCRRMTVASLKEGHVSARRWDLDHVAQRKDWILLKLTEDEIDGLPLIDELRENGHGTLVLWENLDRLIADGTPIADALGNRMDVARDHLSLIFHRFLDPPVGTTPVSISINCNPLKGMDPFLTRHKATQVLPVQKFNLGSEDVTVTPYVLPHLSKLKNTDLDLAGGTDGLRRNQGFYIYRNRRLISWGSWFRLVRQEELTKLARVQVDLSNKLDHLWHLDIKKSTTYPPESLREGLKQIISRITDTSRRVYTYRGRKTDDRIVHAWERVTDRDGITYQINRNHPLAQAAEAAVSDEGLRVFGKFIRLIEQTLPLDALYADMASEQRPNNQEIAEGDEQKLVALAEEILSTLGRDTPAGRQFLNSIATIEPFNRASKSVQAVLQALGE